MSYRVDQFFVKSKTVGRMLGIKLRHDNTGINASWYVDKVVVEDMEMMRTYEFPCESWLSKDHGDKAVEREFAVEGKFTVVSTYLLDVLLQRRRF